MNNIEQEVLYNILIKLPLLDVARYCQTDLKARSMCQDSYFWLLKLNQDFQNGNFFKPSDYVQAYGYSMDINTYRRWDHAKATQYKEIFAKDHIIKRETYKLEEKKDILMWLLESGLYRNYMDVNDIRKFLNQVIDICAIYNDDDILKWLASQDIKYNASDVNHAITHANINLLRFLLSKGYKPNLYTLKYRTFTLLILQILAEYGILIGRADVNNLAGNNDLELLQWLKQYNLLPDNDEGINNATITAAKTGNFAILDWLATYNVLPDEKAYKIAIGYNNIPMLEWLMAHGVMLPHGIVDYVMMVDKVNILCWLAKHGIFPSQREINQALRKKRLDILQLFAQYNILPSYYATMNALHSELSQGDNTDILQFLTDHGFFRDLKQQTIPSIQYQQLVPPMLPSLSSMVPSMSPSQFNIPLLIPQNSSGVLPLSLSIASQSMSPSIGHSTIRSVNIDQQETRMHNGKQQVKNPKTGR